MRTAPITAICLLGTGISLAWHDPVHALITRSALTSLPREMRQFWGAETEHLITHYCLYPDEYHGATAERKAAMRPYCEVKGRPIHNVTWKRVEDIESLEYLLSNLVEKIRSRDVAAAAKYAGTLAHMLEDSTCPAHALTPPDSPLNTMRDLLPPPPGGARLDTPRLVAQIWRYFGGYFQDDWRVSRKLTLNLGLRYEYTHPVTGWGGGQWEADRILELQPSEAQSWRERAPWSADFLWAGTESDGEGYDVRRLALGVFATRWHCLSGSAGHGDPHVGWAVV